MMKTTLISLAQLKNQKMFLKILIALFVLLSIVTIGMALFEGRHILWFNLPLTIILPYIFYKDLKRIKSIYYDDEAVYISKGYNTPIKKISLDKIRSITIGRIDFSYRLNLIMPVESEKHIYFKYPAFWTPLGSRIKQEQIYDLRDKIDAFKERFDEDYTGETQILKMAELG